MAKSYFYGNLYFSTTDGRGDFVMGNEFEDQAYYFDDESEEVYVCIDCLGFLNQALKDNNIGVNIFEKVKGGDCHCDICGVDNGYCYHIGDFHLMEY